VLVCLCTQVATFRLQTLQRYLYVEPPPRWCALATYFFRQVHGLNYDVQGVPGKGASDVQRQFACLSGALDTAGAGGCYRPF